MQPIPTAPVVALAGRTLPEPNGRVGRSSGRGLPCDRERLCLTLAWTSGRCILTMAGTLDAGSAVALDAQAQQLVGADDVVLDVAGLHHVDESGAVALAGLWAGLRNEGVFCRVRGLHDRFDDSPLELLLHVRRCGPGDVRRHPAPYPVPGRRVPPQEASPA
jgi:anti-anti-sigma regulatory factor